MNENMNVEDEIQRQIEIFQDGLDKNGLDENIIQFIDHTVSVPLKLIPILVGVYEKSEDDAIKILAIASMNCSLRTFSPESYAQVSSELSNNPDYSVIIKKMSGSSITSENNTIRDFSSKLLSLLICLEKEKSRDFIEFLLEKLQNKEFEDDILASIIEIFTKTMESKYFQNFKKSFQDIFDSIFSICTEIIFPSGTALSYNLVLSACNYANMIILTFYEIIENEQSAIKLIESFTGLLKTGETEISKVIYSTLFLLIKNFYQFFDHFMGDMINLIFGNMDSDHIDSIISMPITFWRDVAQYENSIYKNDISKTIFPELSNILFIIIDPNSNNLIDGNFQSLEEEDSLYYISINTIYNFTKVIPEDVFQIVAAKINEIYTCNNFQDPNDIIYALSLFLSITSSSIDQNGFSSYMLAGTFDSILDWAIGDYPYEIKILALYEISSILDHCREFVTDMNKEMSKSLLNHLINNMEFDEGENEIVFLYAQIIDGICKLWENSNDESNIKEYPIFGKLKEVIEEIYQYGIAYNYYNIIRAASLAISNLIRFGYSPDCTNLEIKEWYVQKLDELETESYKIQCLETRITVQSELCMMISTFATKIKDDADLSIRALKILDSFIEDQYFDEASIAIRNIICVIQDVPVDLLDKYLQICYDGIKSKNPSSIDTSCSLLSAIFKYYFNDFTDQVCKFLEALLEVYEERINEIGFSGMHKELSSVLSAIGSILSSSSYSPLKFFDPSFIQNALIFDERIFNDIKEVNNHVVDFRNPEYEDDYIKGILRCYRGYCIAYMFYSNIKDIKTITDNEAYNMYGSNYFRRERDQIICLRNIANIISSNANLFSCQVFFEFFNAYRIVINRCSRNNNMVLIHKYFKQMLKIGKDIPNDKMLKIINEVEKDLKNRDKNTKSFKDTIQQDDDDDDDDEQPESL